MLRTNYVRDNKILEVTGTHMLEEEIVKVRSDTLGVPLIRIFLDKIINAGARLVSEDAQIMIYQSQGTGMHTLMD